MQLPLAYVPLAGFLDRCGESIAVLNQGLLHINQATHLAKVSTGTDPQNMFILSRTVLLNEPKDNKLLFKISFFLSFFFF